MYRMERVEETPARQLEEKGTYTSQSNIDAQFTSRNGSAILNI